MPFAEYLVLSWIILGPPSSLVAYSTWRWLSIWQQLLLTLALTSRRRSLFLVASVTTSGVSSLPSSSPFPPYVLVPAVVLRFSLPSRHTDSRTAPPLVSFLIPFYIVPVGRVDVPVHFKNHPLLQFVTALLHLQCLAPVNFSPLAQRLAGAGCCGVSFPTNTSGAPAP